MPTDVPFLPAIDARALTHQAAGKGRAIAGLLEGLARIAPDQPVLIYRREASWPLPFPKPARWEVIAAPASLPGAWWLARDARHRGATVILAATSYSLAAIARLPVLLMVYDLAIFWAPARTSWRIWVPERLWLAGAVRRSTGIVAISAFTKQELVATIPSAATKTSVAYLAADARFRPASERGGDRRQLEVVRTRYRLPDQFLLFVGTLEPRKNIGRLLAAFASLPGQLQRSVPLVLVGQVGWSMADVLPQLRQLVASGTVRHLDFVADADLPHLYQLATVFLYPSLYEGFGLPPLEAMASGTPVVTSTTSSLPEVVGDAALLVDPQQTTALAAAIKRLLGDPALRHRLHARGVRRARHFSWVTTARHILDRLRALAGCPPDSSRVD